jgi:hypothetical protein
MSKVVAASENISDKIHTIRGLQVMLDFDVASVYQYETRRINEAVRRNKGRFPETFYFQLTIEEWTEFSRSQIATLDNMRLQIVTASKRNERYRPYAFTEQGVAMLSGILKSEVAVNASINIINAFVGMRKLLNDSQSIFNRLTKTEYKLIEHEDKIIKIFDKLEGEKIPNHKLFFDGQIYDAYELLIKIIKSASKSIIVIDSYISDDILNIIKKKKVAASIKIISSATSINKLDIEKFNKEYPKLEFIKSKIFHDRYIIIDNKTLYHLGASLKDLGTKIFSISKIEEKEIVDGMIDKTESVR